MRGKFSQPVARYGTQLITHKQQTTSLVLTAPPVYCDEALNKEGKKKVKKKKAIEKNARPAAGGRVRERRAADVSESKGEVGNKIKIKLTKKKHSSRVPARR